MALNTVSKREAQRDLGLGVDLSYFGIATEDIAVTRGEESVTISMQMRSQEMRVDYSGIEEAVPDSSSPINGDDGAGTQDVAKAPFASSLPPTTAPLPPPEEETIRRPLPRVGTAIRFTSFFSDRPAYGEGRYRVRRLRVKRKKTMGRPIVLAEDERDLFKSPPQQHQLVAQKSTTSLAAPSLYQQLLLASSAGTGGSLEDATGKKRRPTALSPSLQSSPSSPPLVPNPEPLQSIRFSPTSYHPVEIVEWEKSIMWEAPPSGHPSAPPRPTQMHLYAGSVTPIPSGQASRASSAHSSFSRPTSPSPMMIMSLPPALRIAPGSGTQSPLSSSASRVSSPLGVVAPKSLAGRIINVEFASGRWAEQILWDGLQDLPATLPPTHLQLNMNDPYLIFEAVDVAGINEKLAKAEKLIHKRLKRLRHGITSDGKAMVLAKFDKPVNDRFNLSNDKQYDGSLAAPTARKEGSGGASGRQSTSNAAATSATAAAPLAARHLISSRVSVQHSTPALKLSMPFYRTFWNKDELRAWHRPRLDASVLVNRQLHFSKLKSRPGREEPSRRAPPANARTITNSKKLSLKQDTEEFVLLEYSEEFPLLLSNVGMSSFLLNYYRKRNVKDSVSLEGCSFGVERILEPNEASPFWIFGDIRPGETLPVIQNNLLRAPLAEHPTQSTDFLLLKSNTKGQTEAEWYIRNLPPSTLIAGQVFPTMEVFGPHSRKHNTFCRNRIQAFAYRLFKKDTPTVLGDEHRPRLKISRIMAAFPQFSEGSLRKWLKEYADSVRTGHDSGTWRMRSDAPVLSEDDIRVLVTPEMICQYESMLAGQQRLNDAGFLDFGDAEASGGGEDATGEGGADSESPEAKLAPWNLSSNFISAVAGKCPLQLHGPGDPSGIGLAFSFVKGTLPKAAPSGASTKSSETTEHAPTATTKSSKLSAEQVAYRQEIVQIWDAHINSLKAPVATLVAPAGATETPQSQPSGGGSINEELSLFNDADDDTTSVTSRTSTIKASGRKLLIRRTIRDEQTGQERVETETVDDPRIVSAYINQRRVWERKRRRRLIAAAASAARAKKARPDVQPRPFAAPKSRASHAPSKPRKEVFVKCGTCGQVGHMRTNRICPQYAQYEAELAAQESTRLAAESAMAAPTKISISKSVLASVAAAPPAPVPPIRFKLPVAAIMGSSSTAPHQEAPSPPPSAVVPPRAPSPLLQYIPKPKKTKSQLESYPGPAQALIVELGEHLMQILEDLLKIPESWPFHRPVSRTEYPHYFKIIERPLDLGTIKARIKRYYYPSVAAFLDDVRLVRDNCLAFNGADHIFSQTVIELAQKAENMASAAPILELDRSIRDALAAESRPPPSDNMDEVVVDDA